MSTDIEKPEEKISIETRVEEYFEAKKTLKNLRRDLKEIKENHPEFDELKQITEKAKIVRTKIKDDEEIKVLEEKTAGLKDRMDLLKEIIRAEMIEEDRTEITQDGQKLKLVPILKEIKEEQED